MIKKVHLNNGGDFEVDVKPCPFCGFEVEIIHQGNNHTKSQKLIFKCSNSLCRIQRKDAVMSHPIEWLLPKSVESWNRRIDKTQPDPNNQES